MEPWPEWLRETPLSACIGSHPIQKQSKANKSVLSAYLVQYLTQCVYVG